MIGVNGVNEGLGGVTRSQTGSSLGVGGGSEVRGQRSRSGVTPSGGDGAATPMVSQPGWGRSHPWGHRRPTPQHWGHPTAPRQPGAPWGPQWPLTPTAPLPPPPLHPIGTPMAPDPPKITPQPPMFPHPNGPPMAPSPPQPPPPCTFIPCGSQWPPRAPRPPQSLPPPTSLHPLGIPTAPGPLHHPTAPPCSLIP